MACRVDQLSQRTRALLQCPEGSTTCLVGPGAVFQCLQCRTALLCDSGPGQMARDFNQLYLMNRAQVRGNTESTSLPGRLWLRSYDPRGGPTLPGDSCSGPMARGINLFSWATLASVRGSTMLNNSPGRLMLGAERPQGTQALPGDYGSGPMSRRFDQLARAARAQVRGTAVSTISPR